MTDIGNKNANISTVEFTFDEQEMLNAVNFDMKKPVKTTSKKTRAKKSATLDAPPTLLDYLKNNSEVPTLFDWNSKSSFDIKTYEKKHAPVKRENPSSLENILKQEPATPTPKKSRRRVSELPPLEDIPLTPAKKPVVDNNKENAVPAITPRRSSRVAKNRTPLSTIKEPKTIIPPEYFEDRDVDADKIIEGLYVGDYKAGCNKEWLLANNIKYILNLTVSHNKKFEKEAKEFVYKRVNIEDSPMDVDLPKMLAELLPFIEKGISEGGILIHCKLGVSRSGSVTLGYLMHKGNTLEESLQIARKARPVIKPLEGFMDQLKRVELNKISE